MNFEKWMYINMGIESDEEALAFINRIIGATKDPINANKLKKTRERIQNRIAEDLLLRGDEGNGKKKYKPENNEDTIPLRKVPCKQ